MVNGDAGDKQIGASAEKQPNKIRITTPYMTKYEKARVLGTRALQIRYVYDPYRPLATSYLLHHLA
jgi:hypothetical protein